MLAIILRIINERLDSILMKLRYLLLAVQLLSYWKLWKAAIFKTSFPHLKVQKHSKENNLKKKELTGKDRKCLYCFNVVFHQTGKALTTGDEEVYLKQLRRWGVIRKQIEGPGNNVGSRASPIVIHRRLAFLKYLDCRESPNLLKIKILLLFVGKSCLILCNPHGL